MVVFGAGVINAACVGRGENGDLGVKVILGLRVSENKES